MRASGKTNLRVGIFVFAGIVVSAIVVFTIAGRRDTFETKIDRFAYFNDVGGLRQGNVVVMSGVRVGAINDVIIMSDGRVRIDFDLVEDAAVLVRSDSLATVEGRGLLGDKFLQVSAGEGDPLPEEQPIPSREPTDLMTQLAGAGDTIREARETIQNLNLATQAIATPEFREDLQAIIHNIAVVTGMAATGDGTFQRLLTDEELADDFAAAVENARVATREFAAVSRNAAAITDEIRNGDGTAHGLIYGQQGNRLIANAADVAEEMSVALEQILEGDGTLHNLIYEDDADELLENLTAASGDIRHLTGEMRAGRGTIGALLVDPSIYEDLKRLIGDLERNEILRALVRYSIRRDEAVPTPVVTPSAP